MRAPVVSVVVPTYKRPALAAEAVGSVLAQTFRDLEVLLVDDGSPGDVAGAVRAAMGDDPRLVCLRKENGGASSARNHGIEAARGRYVAFLDDDDLYVPGHVASQVARLEAEPDASVAICDAAYEGGWAQDGRTVFTRKHFRPPVGMREMLDGAWVQASQLMVRRADLGGVRFDETYPVCEDIEFLMHLYAEGRRGVLNPEVLVRYRRHDGQATDDDDAIRRGTIRALEAYAAWAPRTGAKLHAYQVARRRAVVLVEQGRLREARPHLTTWLRHRFSSRAFRWWMRSWFA